MKPQIVGGILAGVLGAFLFASLITADYGSPQEPTPSSNPGLARTLFGTGELGGYALILVLIGVVLFVALLGGVFLAKEEERW